MTTWKDTFENVDAKFGAEFKEDNDVCEYGDYRFISFFIYIVCCPISLKKGFRCTQRLLVRILGPILDW